MKIRVWQLLTNLYKNVCNEENVLRHFESINLFQHTTSLHQKNENIWAKICKTLKIGSISPAKQVENTVVKGETTHHEQFLLLP